MLERVDAARWYRTVRLEDDITFIEEPFIKAFYRCNIWHVRGRDRDMLVDSGMGVVSLRQHIPVVTEKTCLAVASHTHFDHIGCHHEFEERYVHRDEAAILHAPDNIVTQAAACVGDDMFDALPPEPYHHAAYSVTGAAATRLLDAGDVIDLGDRRFEVIHAPGHSPGGIMLWEAETQILFSGDTVYDGPLIDDLDHSDKEIYRSTMERIRDLPVRVVHGGHFPSFDGPRYRALIKAYLDGTGETASL